MDLSTKHIQAVTGDKTSICIEKRRKKIAQQK